MNAPVNRLPKPPPELSEGDPAKIAADYLEAMIKRASRTLAMDAAGQLPGALDRLAAKRYPWTIAGVLVLTLCMGFAMGWFARGAPRPEFNCYDTPGKGRACSFWERSPTP